MHSKPHARGHCASLARLLSCSCACVQPVQGVEPHLDGEGAHLQGSDAPALAAGGAAPAPSRRQVELLNALRTRVFLHQGVPW